MSRSHPVRGWYAPSLRCAQNVGVNGLKLGRAILYEQLSLQAPAASLRPLSLAAPGLQVVPVFAGGLDFSAPVKKFFYDPLMPSKAFVNCVISLTGFALVGGPARQVSRVC